MASAAIPRRTTDASWEHLPLHLQSTILGLGAAQLDTCKASAAILKDPCLLAVWLNSTCQYPLMAACYFKLWDVCLHLLAAGHSSLPDKHLYSALFMAARQGQLQVVRALLATAPCWGSKELYQMVSIDDLLCPATGGLQAPSRRRVGPGYLDHPLISAACNGHLEIVELLLGTQARPEVLTRAAQRAAKSGHLAVVQRLLTSSPGCSIPEVICECLKSAAGHARLDVMRYLLQCNVDVTVMQAGWSPYPTAAQSGSAPALQLLCGHGVQLGSREWWDAVYLALDPQASQALHWLLRNTPSDVQPSQLSGPFTALSRAARQGWAGTVQVLLDHGLRSQSALDDAMCEAAQGGHVHVMEVLSAHGAHVDGGLPWVFEPESPLGRALQLGQESAARWLLQLGSVSNRVLVYALQFSGRQGGLCRLLLKHGVQDECGLALLEAARAGSTHVLQLLLESFPRAYYDFDDHLEQALCLAASTGQLATVTALLQWSAAAAAAPPPPPPPPTTTTTTTQTTSVAAASAAAAGHSSEALAQACQPAPAPAAPVAESSGPPVPGGPAGPAVGAATAPAQPPAPCLPGMTHKSVVSRVQTASETPSGSASNAFAGRRYTAASLDRALRAAVVGLGYCESLPQYSYHQEPDGQCPRWLYSLGRFNEPRLVEESQPRQVFKLLVQQGAHVGQQDGSLLQMAVQHCNIVLLHALLATGVFTGEACGGALQEAISRGSPCAYRKLLTRAAPLPERDWQALAFAIQHGIQKAVEYLLKQHRVDVAQAPGDTALALAIRYKRPGIAVVLLQHGAPVTVDDRVSLEQMAREPDGQVLQKVLEAQGM